MKELYLVHVRFKKMSKKNTGKEDTLTRVGKE